MAKMPESVCKKNEDGSLRWGCRVIPATLPGDAEDDDARRKECAAVATLFRAAPLLHEALEAVEWAGMHEDGYSMCPRCKALEGDDAGHEPWCLIGNALNAARGEK